MLSSMKLTHRESVHMKARSKSSTVVVDDDHGDDDDDGGGGGDVGLELTALEK